MAVKTTVRTQPDTYFDLVKEFPLTRIHDNKHLREAIKMIDRLLAKDLDEGSQNYLDVLTDLVEAYEDDNVIIPEVSEADLLREMMRGRSLTQQQLAKTTGIAQSTVSAVLNGKRSLTREQAIVLAKYFGVSANAFFSI